MKIKTLVYSLAITLTGVLGDTSLAQAAPQPSPEPALTRAGRLRSPESIKRAKLTRLKKDLGLDEQQIQAITPIIDSYTASVQNVKNDGSLDSHVRRLKLSDLRKHYDSDIDALLTPEQQEKLASIKAERRARLRRAKATSQELQPAENPEASKLPATVH
jgi:hypothetical protein